MSIGNKNYTLSAIDEAGLTAEIERQKKVVEEQKAAEKAAAELKAKKAHAEEVAKSYYQNGVYVASYQTLYYSASYDSYSPYTYNCSGNKAVYGYEISKDGETIWLKLYTSSTSRNGYTGYVWIPIVA